MIKIEEVKKLQEMGFTLDEISKTYFKEESGNNAPEPEKNKDDQGAAAGAGSGKDSGKDEDGKKPDNVDPEEDKKKDDFSSLREEIKQLKNNLFKQSSRENKEDPNNKKTDPILSAFNTIINGKEF